MDGILAMEGEGPSNGRPRQLGKIIVADNAPAMDRVAASIIGFDPEEILTTRLAELRGLTLNSDRLKITGLSLAEAKVSDFILPKDHYLRMIPQLAHEILGKFIWTRPEVNGENCDSCYACVDNCPTKAMHQDGGAPEINPEICINCYCCDEVCPRGAIIKKMSWLAKRLT
jgi:ferredoxin